MKGILIDPFDETITEVDHNVDYRQIYALLSHPDWKVTTFTTVNLRDGNVLFVDDEGLLKNPKHFFKYRDYPQPLAGKGLILGCNDYGETIATNMTLAQVKASVEFTSKLRVAGFDQRSGKTNHPVFGEMNTFVSRPVFVDTDRFEALLDRYEGRGEPLSEAEMAELRVFMNTVGYP